MGVATSHMPWERADPREEFCVHGITYWPGKIIPYKHWPSAILDKQTGITFDEQTIIKGGAKSKRAKIIARFQRLVESYSDEDLSNPNSTKARIIARCQRFIDSQLDEPDFCVDGVTSSKQCRRRHKRKSTCDEHIDDDDDDVRPKAPKCADLNTQTNTFSNTENEQSDSGISVTGKGISDFESLKRDKELYEDKWKSFSYPFENLVFSGGGIKGYAYIGAIKALEDAGVMRHVKRFAGSSAGAMCIAALAVGYNAQDLARFFYVDLRETFQDQQCACICCVPKLYYRYGIHPAMRYYTGLGDILAAKCGNPDLTFKQFNELYEKELVIVVCNITKMCAEYCHHTTTPDLPIRQAVRMSMAIPCIFEPPVRQIDGQANYYIDGSTGDHFPLHCFDGPTVGSNPNAPTNQKTIGFYALQERDVEHVMWHNAFGSSIPPHYKPLFLPDSKLARGQLKEEIKRRRRTQRNFNEKAFMNQLEKFSHASLEHLGLKMKHYEAPNKTHIEPNNIIDYLVANLESLLISQVMSNLKPHDEDRTIPINCGYIESHDYDLEPADREFMIMQGYASTRLFLQSYANKHTTSGRESSV